MIEEYESTISEDGEHVVCPYCLYPNKWSPFPGLDSTYDQHFRVTLTCERCKSFFSAYFYWREPVFVGEPWSDHRGEMEDKDSVPFDAFHWLSVAYEYIDKSTLDKKQKRSCRKTAMQYAAFATALWESGYTDIAYTEDLTPKTLVSAPAQCVIASHASMAEDTIRNAIGNLVKLRLLRRIAKSKPKERAAIYALETPK